MWFMAALIVGAYLLGSAPHLPALIYDRPSAKWREEKANPGALYEV